MTLEDVYLIGLTFICEYCVHILVVNIVNIINYEPEYGLKTNGSQPTSHILVKIQFQLEGFALLLAILAKIMKHCKLKQDLGPRITK